MSWFNRVVLNVSYTTLHSHIFSSDLHPSRSPWQFAELMTFTCGLHGLFRSFTSLLLNSKRFQTVFKPWLGMVVPKHSGYDSDDLGMVDVDWWIPHYCLLNQVLLWLSLTLGASLTQSSPLGNLAQDLPVEHRLCPGHSECQSVFY